MATIEDREALRVRMLQAANEVGMRGLFGWPPWAKEQGVDESDAQDAVDWLKARGLLKAVAWGHVAITADGIDALDEMERAPASAGAGAGEMVDLVVFRQLENVVAELRSVVESHQHKLDPDILQDLMAQAETIEAQSRSPRPRRSVIEASIAAVKWTAENAAAGLVEGGALALTLKVAQSLGLT